MGKPKIGNFRLNNLDKPIVQLDVRDGTVKCRYVVHLEIDGIVYVVDRADKLAMGLFIDAVGEGWDPERWKEEIRREIEYLEQDLQKIGHLADELREEGELDELGEEADELREEADELKEKIDELREEADELREEEGELREVLRDDIEYLYWQEILGTGGADELREKIEYLQELQAEIYQKIEYLEQDLREETEHLQVLEEEKRQKEAEIGQKIEYLEQDLREETEYLQVLEYEYSDLQELEYEYPEGLLEVSPWKSGKIRLSHGNTEEKIPVEEFKRRHKCKKNRRKLNIRSNRM